MANVRVPETRCEVCMQKLTGAANPQAGRGPIDGDFTVCINCGTIGRFTDNQTKIVQATEKEMAELLIRSPSTFLSLKHLQHLINKTVNEN